MSKNSFKFLRYGLFLVLSLVLAITSGQAQGRTKTYLLAVGIGDYAHSDIPRLKLACNDVDTIAGIISQRNSEVMVLKNSEATARNIKRCMQQLFSKATRRDIVMLFFSGHGYQGGFCPYDYYMGDSSHVDYEEVRDILSKTHAYGKFVIADACHSGGLRTPSTHKSDSMSENQIRKAQILLFLSSRGNEVSYESSAYTNGVFTKFLADAFRGAADSDRNGKITAWEMFSFVSRNVRETLFDRQHPVMWGSFNKRLIMIDNTKP